MLEDTNNNKSAQQNLSTEGLQKASDNFFIAFNNDIDSGGHSEATKMQEFINDFNKKHGPTNLVKMLLVGDGSAQESVMSRILDTVIFYNQESPMNKNPESRKRVTKKLLEHLHDILPKEDAIHLWIDMAGTGRDGYHDSLYNTFGRILDLGLEEKVKGFLNELQDIYSITQYTTYGELLPEELTTISPEELTKILGYRLKGCHTLVKIANPENATSFGQLAKKIGDERTSKLVADTIKNYKQDSIDASAVYDKDYTYTPEGIAKLLFAAARHNILIEGQNALVWGMKNGFSENVKIAVKYALDYAPDLKVDGQNIVNFAKDNNISVSVKDGYNRPEIEADALHYMALKMGDKAKLESFMQDNGIAKPEAQPAVSNDKATQQLEKMLLEHPKALAFKVYNLDKEERSKFLDKMKGVNLNEYSIEACCAMGKIEQKIADLDKGGRRGFGDIIADVVSYIDYAIRNLRSENVVKKFTDRVKESNNPPFNQR